MSQERNQPSKRGAEVLARMADGFQLRKSPLGGARLVKGPLRHSVAEATVAKLEREGYIVPAKSDEGRSIWLAAPTPEPADTPEPRRPL